MTTLKEIGRQTYGHDERAINKHAERLYRDEAGRLYVLSRTLDGCPPFFEAYGPFKDTHRGVLPRLKVTGREYPPSPKGYGGLCWGSGWSWRRAIKAFCTEIGAELKGRRPCSSAKVAEESTKARSASR